LRVGHLYKKGVWFFFVVVCGGVQAGARAPRKSIP